MTKCEICGKKEAQHECEYCGRLFCDNCGDLFFPDEEWICYDCVWELEIREQMDKLFFEEEYLRG